MNLSQCGWRRASGPAFGMRMRHDDHL